MKDQNVQKKKSGQQKFSGNRGKYQVNFKTVEEFE